MQGNSFTKINVTSKLLPFYFRRSVLVGALFLLFVLWIFAIFAKSFRVSIHFERKENPALLKRIDQQCLKLERQNLEKPELFSNFQTDMENTNLELKQHLIAKTLKFFPTLNQMWCFVPRTGEEETWKALVLDYNMLQSTPPSSPIVSNVAASRIVSPGQDYVRAIMSDSVSKILLTRHPFARIADYFQKNIIATNKIQSVLNILVKKGKHLTFPEFVDYLLSTSERNYPDDLRPIFQLCGLCHIKYQQVLRYEDMNFTGIPLLKSLEMEPVVTREKAPRKAKTFHPHARFGNQLFYMYQGIPRQKLLLLYRRYKTDFQLLNYSFYDVIPDSS